MERPQRDVDEEIDREQEDQEYLEEAAAHLGVDPFDLKLRLEREASMKDRPVLVAFPKPAPYPEPVPQELVRANAEGAATRMLPTETVSLGSDRTWLLPEGSTAGAGTWEFPTEAPTEEPVPHQLVREEAQGAATRLLSPTQTPTGTLRRKHTATAETEVETEEQPKRSRTKGKMEKRKGDSDTEDADTRKSMKALPPEDAGAEALLSLNPGPATAPQGKKGTTKEVRKKLKEKITSSAPTVVVEPAPVIILKDHPMDEEPTPQELRRVDALDPAVLQAQREYAEHREKVIAEADRRAYKAAEAREERKRLKKIKAAAERALPAPPTLQDVASLAPIPAPPGPERVARLTAVPAEDPMEEMRALAEYDPARVAATERRREEDEEREQLNYGKHLSIGEAEKREDREARREDRPKELPKPDYDYSESYKTQAIPETPKVDARVPISRGVPVVKKKVAFDTEAEARKKHKELKSSMLASLPPPPIPAPAPKPDVTMTTAPPETPTGTEAVPRTSLPLLKPEKKKSSFVKKEPPKASYYHTPSFSGGYIPVDWAAQQKKLDQRYAELRGMVPPAEPMTNAPVMMAREPPRYEPPRFVMLGGGGGSGGQTFGSCMPEEPTPRAVTITKTY